MSPKLIKRIDSPSLAIAGFSILMGAVTGYLERPVFGVMIAILAALLGETYRLQGLISESHALAARMDKVPWVRDRINRIVEVAEEADQAPYSSAVVPEFIKSLATCLLELERLGEGVVVRAVQNTHDLTSETVACNKTLDATTNLQASQLDDGTSWWLTPAGFSYWESNRQAVNRGVVIRRIFIVDQPSSPSVAKLLQQQHDAGVEVYYASAAQLGAQRQVNVAIWDSKTAWRAVSNANGQTIQNDVIHAPKAVERIQELFNSCLVDATQYLPPAVKQ